MQRASIAIFAIGALGMPLGCSDAGASDVRLRPASADVGGVQGRVAGTGTSGLRVRQRPTTASAQIGVLAEGAPVTITCQIDGETIDGSALWDYLASEDGYVADAFIERPKAESIARCNAPTEADPPPGGAVDIEGPPVQPHVQAFADEACRQIGACRATTRDGHEPSADLALDFPTGEDYGVLPTDGHAFGDRLADFALASQANFRIDYVIYRQRINFGQGDGWEPMEDRGSMTANHYDHVHVSFDP